MKAYIINREQDVDRKNFMLQQMKSLEIFDYVFFTAIDKNSITNKATNLSYSEEQVRNHNLSMSEVCCALSHCKIYDCIIRNEKNGAFIFEDDVLISPLLCHIATELLSFLQKDIPIIILLTPVHSFCKNPVERIPQPNRINTLSQNAHKPFPQLSLHKTIFAFSGAGYMINKDAAKVMLKLYSPVNTVIDRWKKRIDCNDIFIYNLNHYLISINNYGRKSSTLENERQAAEKIRNEKLIPPTLYVRLRQKYRQYRRKLFPPYGHVETW
ncbi:MAG: glycosyltransferase family 25 protein [Lentisphaeria bacterium]